MPEPDDFLRHNIEQYLFDDLRVMQGLPTPPAGGGGGLGYPLLMSALAGIELLGALVSQSPFDTNSGRSYFREYWQLFLYPNDVGRHGAADFIYTSARNAITHSFLLKGQVGIVKGQPAWHLTKDASGAFYIDASQLASDLIVSYEARVKPCLTAATSQLSRATILDRVQELQASYAKTAQNAVTKTPSPGGMAPASIGISGLSGPVSSSVSRTAALSAPLGPIGKP